MQRHAGRALGLILLVSIPIVAKAQVTVETEGSQSVQDFQAYKSRLVALIVNYKRFKTTAFDMEDIVGQKFPIKDDKGANEGWIRKSLSSFKSLTFRNEIDIYYGSPVDKNIWNGPTYFEVQYYANFQQDENLNSIVDPLPVFLNQLTCFTLAEFREAVTKRNAKLTAPERRVNYDEFLVSADDGGPLKESGISVLASFKPVHYDPNSKEPMDVSEGCLTSIGIS